jgi:hypothetical protein
MSVPVAETQSSWCPRCEVIIEGAKLFVTEVIPVSATATATATATAAVAAITSPPRSVCLNVADMQIRLKETGSATATIPRSAMNFAIEVRDKATQIVLGVDSLNSLVKLCSKLFEAMKLLGAVDMNLESFHTRCLNAWQEKLQLSEECPSQTQQTIQKLLLSPRRPSKLELDTSDVLQENNFNGANTSMSESSAQHNFDLIGTDKFSKSSRVDIMTAAESLEELLNSFKLPPTFPSVANIYNTLESLETLKKNNHQSICELIKLEAIVCESDTESESGMESAASVQHFDDDDHDSNSITGQMSVSMHGQLANFSAPLGMDDLVDERESFHDKGMTDNASHMSNTGGGGSGGGGGGGINVQLSQSSDSLLLDGQTPASPGNRPSRADSILRLNSNSSVMKDSPTVFVPPADMSKDRRTIRNIVPNSSLRRPSVQELSTPQSNDGEAPLIPVQLQTPPDVLEETETSSTVPPPPPPPAPPPPKQPSDGGAGGGAGTESDAKNENSSDTQVDKLEIEKEKDTVSEVKQVETTVLDIATSVVEKTTPATAPSQEKKHEGDNGASKEKMEVVVVCPSKLPLELSRVEQQQCAALLVHLRDHPEHFVEMASQCIDVSVGNALTITFIHSHAHTYTCMHTYLQS